MAAVVLTGIDALAAFMRRFEGELAAEQRLRALQREAGRHGVDEAAWRALREAPVSIETLKAVHHAVSGDQTHVRRTLHDGSSKLAPAQPGQLRTKPQAFRVGEHVEVAWHEGKLKAGLAELLRDIAAERDPIAAAAHLLWTVARAQPFTGNNERVGLVLAALQLRRAGVPGLHVLEIEGDAAYAKALVAPHEELLADYLVRTAWSEALAWAEWIAPVPPTPPARWTLQDEHAVLAAARAATTRLAPADVRAFVARAREIVVDTLAARFALSLGTPEELTLDTPRERIEACGAASMRGRHICPHEPVIVVRWPAAPALGLVVQLVLGAAGRGMTGALSAHLAFEITGSPAGVELPGILIVPDEAADARDARFADWLATNLSEIVERAPLRL